MATYDFKLTATLTHSEDGRVMANQVTDWSGMDMTQARWLEQMLCEFLANLAKVGGPTPGQ